MKTIFHEKVEKIKKSMGESTMSEKSEAEVAEEKRELTEAEKRRAELFQKIKGELEGKGYEMKELTCSIIKANTLGILYAAIVAAPFLIAYFCMDLPMPGEDTSWQPIVLFVLFMLSFVVHELIHGITWSIGAGGFKENIEFGFIAAALTPYCTCKVPMKKGWYLIGSVMPCFLLGIVPCIVALVIGNFFVMVFGALGILGGGGDLLVCQMILCHKSNGKKDQLYLDHPTKIGLALFEK